MAGSADFSESCPAQSGKGFVKNQLGSITRQPNGIQGALVFRPCAAAMLLHWDLLRVYILGA